MIALFLCVGGDVAKSKSYLMSTMLVASEVNFHVGEADSYVPKENY
jgi:hypothetical protein